MTTHIGSLPESSPERKLAPDSSFSLPLAWRIGLSVVLLYHLAAVFLPPFQFACRVGNGSSSPVADGLIPWFRPYIGALYLDHGYFFFAPNPGPSHLVDYKIEFADGRAPVTGRFPNLAQHQPRLKYHRHFMIAEALNNQFEPPNPPPEPSPPPLNAEQSSIDKKIRAEQLEQHRRATAEWQHRRRQYEAMTASIHKHLLSTHGGDARRGDKVTLTRVEHRLLFPFEVEELGRKPEDPSTYVNLLETMPAPPQPSAGATGVLPRGDAR